MASSSDLHQPNDPTARGMLMGGHPLSCTPEQFHGRRQNINAGGCQAERPVPDHPVTPLFPTTLSRPCSRPPVTPWIRLCIGRRIHKSAYVVKSTPRRLRGAGGEASIDQDKGATTTASAVPKPGVRVCENKVYILLSDMCSSRALPSLVSSAICVAHDS